jgi:hypothetical protein
MTTRKGGWRRKLSGKRTEGMGWLYLGLARIRSPLADRDTYGKIILLLLNFCFLRRMHVINSIGVNRHR